MKRIFALLLALLLAAMLTLPALAETTPAGQTVPKQTAEDAGQEEDGQEDATPTPAPTPEPTPAPTPEPDPDPLPAGAPAAGAYVTMFLATTVQGGELNVLNPGDHFNLIVYVADYEAKLGADYAPLVQARINSTAFTYTGIADVRPQESSDGSLQYRLLFYDLIYNGGSSNMDITLSYFTTTIPVQTLPIHLDQCVTELPEQGGGPGTAGAPTLIIRNVDYGTSVITAGQTFQVSVRLTAGKGSANLEDVIVRLQPGSGLSLASGSSSAYVGTVRPNSSHTVTFELKVSSAFTGQDGNGIAQIGVSATGAEPVEVSIPIEQPDRFELGSLEIYDTLYVGDRGSVTLNFVNKGQNTVTNLEARISGTNFVADDTYLYLGNVAPGTENSVDFDITPEMAGPVSGVITLTYEYADGTTKTLTKDFSATAEDMMSWGGWEDPGFYEPIVPEEPVSSGFPGWGIALIVALVVAAAVAVILIVKKRRKAKAMAALEGEDEDF